MDEQLEKLKAPQSLMLMNNGHIRTLAGATAARVDQILADEGLQVGPVEGTRGRQVDTVYHLALSRPPSDQERKMGIETLKELESAWQGQPHKALDRAIIDDVEVVAVIGPAGVARSGVPPRIVPVVIRRDDERHVAVGL